jgi:hypothetical protein
VGVLVAVAVRVALGVGVCVDVGEEGEGVGEDGDCETDAVGIGLPSVFVGGVVGAGVSVGVTVYVRVGVSVTVCVRVTVGVEVGGGLGQPLSAALTASSSSLTKTTPSMLASNSGQASSDTLSSRMLIPVRSSEITTKRSPLQSPGHTLSSTSVASTGTEITKAPADKTTRAAVRASNGDFIRQSRGEPSRLRNALKSVKENGALASEGCS